MKIVMYKIPRIIIQREDVLWALHYINV